MPLFVVIEVLGYGLIQTIAFLLLLCRIEIPAEAAINDESHLQGCGVSFAGGLPVANFAAEM